MGNGEIEINEKNNEQIKTREAEVLVLREMQKQLNLMIEKMHEKKRGHFLLVMFGLLFTIAVFVVLFAVVMSQNLYTSDGLYFWVFFIIALLLTINFFAFSVSFKYTISANKLLHALDTLITVRKREIKELKE